MRRTFTACAAAAVFLAPLASRAGFLDARRHRQGRGHGVQGVGSFVGGISAAWSLARRGIVEAIVSPAIQSLESSGHKLIEDLDSRIGAQIERTSRAGSALESQVNLHVSERVEQVNRTPRSASHKSAHGRRADRPGPRAARRSFAKAGRRSRQADEIHGCAGDRASPGGWTVHAIARASIAQADDAVGRIDQADEAVGRRIGNADVVLTKQGLNWRGPACASPPWWRRSGSSRS